MTERIIDLRDLREAFEAYQQTRQVREVKEGVARAFDELEKNDSMTGFGIARELDDSDLALHVSRERFPVIAGTLRGEAIARIEEKRVKLQIVRAILERSPRLWEFVWRGNRIAAPVVDSEFYDALYTRNISLAAGDILDVTLAIKQRPIRDTGIFKNVGYEVRKVHQHDATACSGKYRRLGLLLDA